MPHQAGHSYQDLIGQAQANYMIDELQGLLSPSQTYSPSGNVTGPQISQGVDYTGMSSGSIDQLIDSVAGSGGISGLFGSIFDNIGPIASTAGGLASVLNAYNRLGSIGDFANVAAGQIGEDAFARSQFKPFTVTTGTGSSIGVGVPAPGSFDQMGQEARIQQLMDTQGLTREQAMANQQTSQMRGFDINNDGVVTNQEFAAARNAGVTGTPTGGGAFTGAGPMIGPNIQTVLSPEQQAISSGAFTDAQTLLGNVVQDRSAREQEIFDRIRATQEAEEERNRLALEERLFNQGRLGVRTSMFGGTPEQLALAKAEEEARNRASLLAIQQAEREQAQDARLGTQLLGAAFLPEAQAQNAFRNALTAAEINRRANQFGTGLFAQSSIAGLDALLGSGIGQAELMGRLGTGLLGGAIQGAGQGQGGIGDILSGAVSEFGPDILRQLNIIS
jgi:hypothetical protein